MTETRTCDECGKHLVIQRRGARFCGEECKNAWHNKHRRSQPTTRKRLAPVEGGVGTRGGNVRSVDEARQLQTASKALDRWRLVMEQQIFRTLLGTGRFHVDDLDCLELPPEAFEVRGTLVNSVRASGVMQSTGIGRKVAHKAANARKAPIYEITAKGKQQLPRLVGVGAGSEQQKARKSRDSTDSGEKHEIVGAADAIRHGDLGVQPGANRVGCSGDHRGDNSEGSTSAPTDALDRPGGLTQPSPPDGAESSLAASGAGDLSLSKSEAAPPPTLAPDTDSPDQSTTTGPSTGGNGGQGRPITSLSAGGGAPASEDQLLETLCNEFDAQVVVEDSAPTTLFGSVPSAYDAWSDAA